MKLLLRLTTACQCVQSHHLRHIMKLGCMNASLHPLSVGQSQHVMNHLRWVHLSTHFGLFKAFGAFARPVSSLTRLLTSSTFLSHLSLSSSRLCSCDPAYSAHWINVMQQQKRCVPCSTIQTSFTPCWSHAHLFLGACASKMMSDVSPILSIKVCKTHRLIRWLMHCVRHKHGPGGLRGMMQLPGLARFLSLIRAWHFLLSRWPNNYRCPRTVHHSRIDFSRTSRPWSKRCVTIPCITMYRARTVAPHTNR